MNLDDVFEQKNEIAKAVEDELEKVCVHICWSSKAWKFWFFWLTLFFTV